MPQCVIIADDLTGANATGVLMKKLHFKTATLLDLEGVDINTIDDYDVITYTTNSRGICMDMAYDRVLNVASFFKDSNVKLFNKRIDSTLRGNLGAEIDGILDSLTHNHIAFVVPSFPKAGRIAVGGYLLVDNTMLQNTDAARDPKTPINTSKIEELVKKQTKHPVSSIYLETVYEGKDKLSLEIKKQIDNGSRIIIIDALKDEDFDIIAQAVLEMDTRFITVDPGPFTSTIASKLIKPKTNKGSKKILMVIGSITNITKIQLQEVFKSLKGKIIELDASKLIHQDSNKEIERVVQLLQKYSMEDNLLCITTNGINSDMRLDLNKVSNNMGISVDGVSSMINESLAEITYRVFQHDEDFKGIFSSGGDTTVAICKRFNSLGINLLQEVYPLVAYGALINSDFKDLKIVTKGGMIGDKYCTRDAILFLREQLDI